MWKLISQSNRSLVYMETNELAAPVIWKVCSSSNSKISAYDLANEFSITRDLHIKGIRKPLKSGVYENKDAFSYRYFAGMSLKKWIISEKFDLGRFLNLALAITKTLKELHQAGIAHLRINSNNILYKPEEQEIEIIDFSAAGKDVLHHYVDFQEVESELSYIAPEQSGMLKQSVDNRTDLYSLGILFYELLTGKLPFYHSDKSTLVHMHMVQNAIPACEVNGHIPFIISGIVDKLLCKNPDDRYQTAYGLEYDLSLCADKYHSKEDIVPFQLALKDNFHQFRLSPRLYGRDDEINKILSGIDSIMHGGSEIYIISGDTGTGKTEFAQYFRQKFHEKGGIMITGQFDQLSQNVPHTAMINALKELSSVILSEPEDSMIKWRALLKKAILGNEELLLDLIPELEWIIAGDQNNSDDDPFLKKEISFNKIFREIVQQSALLKKFFVLFLDDLYWADSASLNGVYSLITDNPISHFMLILSCRTSQVDKKGGFEEVIEKFRSLKPDIAELRMNDLTREQIKLFIDESLVINDSGELSNIVYEKTLGNPFYVHQLFHSVFADKALFLNYASQKWAWDKIKFANVHITENVIEFLTEKIKRLRPQLQKTLTYASCIGNTFEFKLLSSVIEMPETTLKELFKYLTDENFIREEESETFRFLHKRLRQIMYDLIPVDEKSHIHYLIATALFTTGINEISVARLYEIAGHFNAGKSNIPQSQNFAIVQLNLKAGLEAKRSSAFELSYNYLFAAIGFLEESDWRENYDIVLNIYLEATRMALICGKPAEAEQFLVILINNAKTIADRIKAYEIKLNHLSENHHFPETIALLLPVLTEIGYRIERHPGKIALLKEYAKVKWCLKDKNISNIPRLPLMENERAIIFMRLTVNSLASIFGAAPDILPLVIFRQVQLSLRYGNSVYAPFAYCFYGFALCAFMGDIKKGYSFGKMALYLTEKLQADIVRTKVMVSFYGFLSYWIDNLRVSVVPLGEAYLAGRKTGDLLYAAFALSFQSSIRLHSGDYLPELLDIMTKDCETIKSINQDLVYNISESQRQFVMNLANEVKDFLILNNDGFNEAEFLEKLVTMNDEASKFDFYYYKMTLACIFNNYDEAFKNSELASRYEEETTARQITYPSYILHSVIASFKEISKPNPAIRKEKLIRKIVTKIKLLKEFTRNAPQNFKNKYTLIQAFWFEYKGRPEEAIEYAYKSIQQAQKYNFIHEEALAREYLAFLYFKNDKNEYAELMLTSAFNCYQKWGALGKCRQLMDIFPEILSERLVKGKADISGFQNIYDLNSIIKSNQALSLENTLEGLLKTMLEIVIENATVNNAVIIIKSKNEKFIAAAAGNNEKIMILDPDDENNYKIFPVSVINYVVRTKSVYVSNNFLLDKKFAFDTFKQAHTSVSVCAIPLIIKNNVIGILYLENNLAEAAFDNRRVEFFKTISSQLAISIDNVFLYNEMEQKVKDRTSELIIKNTELESEKKKSDDLLLNILPAETAKELKDFGKTSARSYNSVTVLFADIKDFSKIAGMLGPEELVSELDLIFKKFDEICSTYNLEKIKTIGDGYLAVAGLPENNKANAMDVIKAAIEMQQFIQNFAEQRKQERRQFFEIRIGIHTGPVVAGVVGNKKFQYDIWGDTVNIAARVEQSSYAGRINISQATYDIVKDNYNCVSRGKIGAKNIGEVEMYFVGE